MLVLKNILTAAAIAVFFASCTDDAAQAPADTLSKGNIDISVDETYRPIIEQELKVFDSSFPEAHITAHYKSEAECINDFMTDKARLILITRELSSVEKKQLENKKIVPASLAIAKDAVALVVNNNAADTILSVAQVKGILTGVYKTKYTVVFDNQGSSTLRYVMDSLIPGQKLGANVFAAKGNDAVINYVAGNAGAIGLVGVSHISDYTDVNGLAFTDKVHVVAIVNEASQKTYKPYQAYIAPNWYPLTRNLYYIHRETYPGLGTGFANFLSKERGQLIFKQARLFPLRSNIIFRDAQINTQQ